MVAKIKTFYDFVDKKNIYVWPAGDYRYRYILKSFNLRPTGEREKGISYIEKPKYSKS